jgi:putative MATE family efflux protein
MALPIVISMLIQALYNVVDSIFVAKINEDALTALSLAFPIQNLIIAAATGLGVGINALLSKKLGERNFDYANKVACNGIIIELCAFLIFLVIGIFAVPAFIHSQTDIPRIAEYGIDYLRICCIFSFGVFLQITFERLLQSTGKTIYSMITQMSGAIINIILDPIFIFGFSMGVKGAAIATILGQFVSATLGFILNKKKNTEIKLSFKDCRLSKDICSKVLAVGIPSTIMASIGSVMTFCMNKILMVLSSTAVAVFGIFFKLQSIILMPIFGLNNGMVPIIAYNYGARKKERIKKTIKLSVMYALIIMFMGLATMQLFPKQLLYMFDASENMISIGVTALRTISLSFIFAGFCIIATSVFQAFGDGIYSMFISIARQLLVLVPVAYLFSLTANINLIWFAFPIAEIVSTILCCIYLIKIYKKKIRDL